MAERSNHRPAETVTAWRLRGLATTAIAAVSIAGLPGTGMPPPPPAPLPDRVRIRWADALAPAVASVPDRTVSWWIRLRSVSPGIGRTPPSRPDTPALPTVGRPRDGPLSGTGVARVGAWARFASPGGSSIGAFYTVCGA